MKMNKAENNERGQTIETIVGTASKEAILPKLKPRSPQVPHTPSSRLLNPKR
jgi:hypothetical protein